jgi:hypothetical protein
MLAERLGELGACAGEALANRLRRLAEDLGDLGRRQAFDADQERDFAVGRRERGKRTLERELGLGIRERLERRPLVAGGLAAR